VKDMSIEIPDKKITTIIGSNGCGKSTLLKALTRIIRFQSGSIILDGKSITKEDTKKLAKKMAILPQNPESAGGLTVGELVSYGRFPYQSGFGRLSKRDIEIVALEKEWFILLLTAVPWRRAAFSVTGGIAFVGLMAPHIV
jgi:iron complex transport system ATP-binding protein